MSATVDNRIVSMEFDNKQFEEGVKESIGSLNKLSKTIDSLPDSADSLEQVGKTLKNIDFSSLVSSVETLANRFTGLGAVAYSALDNIVNKATDAGVQLAKSLTIDQLTSGFQKYEEKTASVQTIMAATGESIENVNDILSELMWYTDETSYNFVDMVSNIGKFTSAGQRLKPSATVMQGIASAIALAGGNAQTATRVMYNLSQAMGIGYMGLSDWRSIELANAGTVTFKKTILEAAAELGTLKKVSEDTYTTIENETLVTVSNFTEALKEKWLTSDVLMKVGRVYGNFSNELKKFTELTDLSATETLTFLDEYERGVVTIEETAEDLGVSATVLKKSVESLISPANELGRKAFLAAQEAKTYNDAINAVKDAASSQFMTMFESIFGGYDKARVQWTEFSNTLWDVFVAPIESLNELISGAFDSSWDKILKQVKGCGVNAETFKKTIAELNGTTLADINEKFGSFEEYLESLPDSADAVTKAMEKMASVIGVPYDVDEAYENINEIIQKTMRGEQALFDDPLIAQYDRDAVTKLYQKAFAGEKLTIDDISEALQTNIGVTQETSDALYELAGEAKNADSELGQIVNTLNEASGRELFFESILNAFKIVGRFMEIVGEAWSETIGVFTSGELFSSIKSLNDFTSMILLNLEEGADGYNVLKNVLKALFKTIGAGIKTIKPFISMGVNLIEAFLDPLADILNYVALSIDFLFGKLENSSTITVLGGVINFVYEALLDIANVLKLINIPQFLSTLYDSLSEFIHIETKFTKPLKRIKETIVDLFMNLNFENLKNGTVVEKINDIAEAFRQLGQTLTKENIVDALHSIKEGFGNFVENLKNTDLVQIIGGWFTRAIEDLKSIDWDSLFASVITAFQEAAFATGKLIGASWVAIKEAISAGAGYISKAFEELTTDPEKAIDDFINQIDSKISEVITLFKESYPKTYAAIVKFKDGIKDALLKAFGVPEEEATGFFGFLKEAAMSIANILPILGSMLAAIIETLSNFYLDIKKTLNTNGTYKTVVLWGKRMFLIAGIVVGVATVIQKVRNAINALKIPEIMTSISGMFNAGKSLLTSLKDGFFKQWTNVAVSRVFENIAQILLTIAEAVAILVIAIAILQHLPTEGLWKAVGIVAVLTIVLGAIFAYIIHIVDTSKNIKEAGSELISAGSLSLVLIAFIAGIYALMLAIKLLAGMKLGDFIGGGLALIALAGVMGLICFGIKKIIGATGSLKNYIKKLDVNLTGLNVLAFSLAIGNLVLILSAVAFLYSKIPDDRPWLRAGKIVASMIIIIMIVAIGLSMIDRIPISTTIGLFGMVAAIGMLAAIVSALALISYIIPYEKMWEAVLIIAGIGTILTILTAVTSSVAGADGGKEISKTLLRMAAALAILGMVLAVLSLCDTKSVTDVALAIGVLVFVLGLVAYYTSEPIAEFGKGMIMLAGSAVLMAAALFLAGAAIYEYGNKAVGGIALIIASFLALGIIAKFFAKDLSTFGVSMFAIAAGALLFAAAIYVAGKAFKDCGIIETILGFALLGGIIALLVALSGVLGAAAIPIAAFGAALIIVGVSTLIFAGALWLISKLIPAITDGFVYLCNVLSNIDLGAARENLAQFEACCWQVTVAMLGLAIAAALLCVGVLILTIPLVIIAVALLAVSLAALAFAGAVSILINNLANVAPYMESIGIGLEKLAESVEKIKGKGVAWEILKIAAALGALSWATGGTSAIGSFFDGIFDSIFGFKENLESADISQTIGNFTSTVISETNVSKEKIGVAIRESGKETGKTIGIAVKEATVEANKAGEKAGKDIDIAGWFTDKLSLGDGDIDIVGAIKTAVGGEGSVDVKDILSGVIGGEDSFDVKDLLSSTIKGNSLDATQLISNMLGGEGSLKPTELVTSLIGGDGSFDISQTLESALGGEGSVDPTQLLSGMMGGEGSVDPTQLISGMMGEGSLDISQVFGKSLDNGGTENATKLITEYMGGQGSVDATQIFSNVIGDKALDMDAVLSGSGIDLSGITDLSKYVDATSIESVQGVFGEFMGTNFSEGAELAENDIIASGKESVIKYADSIRNTGNKVVTETKTVVQNAAQTAKNESHQFYTAGENAGIGFANGLISSNVYTTVTNAARRLAEVASSTVKNANESRSPSRLYMRLGSYCGEGLAIGMVSTVGEVESAAKKMAESAITTASNLTDHILAAMSEDMSPVITPVLDLSDVESKSGRISSLFGGRQTAGLTSSILSGTGIIQNGTTAVEAQNAVVSLDAVALAALARNNNVDSGSQEIKINFTGSLAQLAKVLQPEITRETSRRGNSLIRG